MMAKESNGPRAATVWSGLLGLMLGMSGFALDAFASRVETYPLSRCTWDTVFAADGFYYPFLRELSNGDRWYQVSYQHSYGEQIKTLRIIFDDSGNVIDQRELTDTTRSTTTYTGSHPFKVFWSQTVDDVVNTPGGHGYEDARAAINEITTRIAAFVESRSIDRCP